MNNKSKLGNVTKVCIPYFINPRYLILFLLIGLQSCTQDKIHKNSIPYLIPANLNHLNLADYIEELEVIPIDSSIYMNGINHMRSNDKYFIVKSFRIGFLFFLDKKGKLKYTLKPSGSGPMEISVISNFDISCSSENLLIFDQDKFKIIEYNMVEKAIVREHATHGYVPFSGTCYEDKIYLLTNDRANGLVKKLDYESGDLEDEFVFGPAYVNNVMSDKPFINGTYSGASDKYCSIYFSDTIYHIEEGNLNPLFIVGNKSGIPIDTPYLDFMELFEQVGSQKFSSENLVLNMPRGDNFNIGNIFIINLVKPKDKSCYLLYNQKSENSAIIEKKNVEYKNLLFHENWGFSVHHFDGIYAYSSFYITDHFYESAEKYIDNYNNEISEHLTQLIETYPRDREFENPVIVKFKINEKFQDLLL